MKKIDQKARIVSYIVFTFTTIICVFPFLLLLSASLSDDNAVVQYGYRIIPKVFSLDAYQYILSSREYIFHAYGITILVTAVGTAASLIMTSMLSYPLSNPYLPGRKIFLFIVLFTMLFNGGLVPSYLVYTQLLHIKNTLWALLIPSLLLNGFNVMIMRTFFSEQYPQIFDRIRKNRWRDRVENLLDAYFTFIKAGYGYDRTDDRTCLLE